MSKASSLPFTIRCSTRNLALVPNIILAKKLARDIRDGATTLSLTTLSIMTLGIPTLEGRGLYVSLSLSDSQHKLHLA